MKRWLLLFVLLLMLFASALAEDDLCIIDLAELPASVSTGSSYICVINTLKESVPVSVSVYDAWDDLVYQRNHGECTGTFRSERIFLRLNGGETTYMLNVQCGDNTYETAIIRKLPRLNRNSACAAGLPLSQINGRDTRQTITMLDVAQLSRQPLTVTMHASGIYDLGRVTFGVQDGKLLVNAALRSGVDGEINEASVFVATSSVGALNLDSFGYSGLHAGLEEPIDLQGAAYAAVYVQLVVSFDPATAEINPVITLDDQLELWQRLMDQTENEAVG